MPVDWSTLHKVLRDETRKKIILNLHGAGTLNYTDLLNRLEITNTGKLNYHLKRLNDLLAKTEQGAYMLSEKGRAAAEMLEKLPSQLPTTKTLRGSDVILIGLLGFLLMLPPIFIYFIASAPISASGSSPPSGSFDAGQILFSISALLLSVYPLFVPSLVMWWLTARRTKSHDLYDLMKPPAVAAGIFYIVLVVILLLQRASTLAYQAPPSTKTITQQVFLFALPIVLLLPLISSAGTLLIEGIYRLKARI